MFGQKRLLELLGKYNVPGPRYTSYPTVPAWTESVQAGDYEKALQITSCRSPGSGCTGEVTSPLLATGDWQPAPYLSLYFHLPFCENLCHFCGCMQVITKDHSRSRSYVDLLLKEMDHVRSIIPDKSKKVSQIHFGGGTPNFLQPQELEEIVGKIRSDYQVLPDAEIAIEMHPRTSTKAFCDKLAELKFNRISLGVQDLDPAVQSLINRHQTYEMTKEMINYLRSIGFDSFNFDLVYGLPGQTMEGWKKTLDQVLHLHPNRLAVYSYAHVPWIRPVQRTFKDSDLPSPELKLTLFHIAYDFFTKNGYRLIGMDHFALEDDELSKAMENKTIHRNFMGYSTKAEAHQIGFGVSSISYVNGNYFQNIKILKEYETSIKEKKLATYRGMLLSADDLMRRDLITKLMCHGKILIGDFEKKWGISFWQTFGGKLEKLKDFAQENLVEISQDKIEVVGEGFLFLRNMAMLFDEYLEKVKKESKTPVFSKTV